MTDRRGLVRWVPTYLAGAARRASLRRGRRRALTHLILSVCDHFEPRHGIATAGQAIARLEAWQRGYRALQDDCLRDYGLRPLHTWFYAPHHGAEHLPTLARMAFDGLGEVELHYHHGNDSEATLRAALVSALAEFWRWGLLQQLGTPVGRRFGFIHGDWSLNNSRGDRFCGVNSESALLRDLGCWGDLTMPSAEDTQTRKINSIYYAINDPHRPNSHDWGDDARVGAPERDGLLMIQGPLGFNWRGPRYPRVENACLTTLNWGRRDRIEAWLNCHVHVRGRPEWVFAKLHTHGAYEKDFDGLFGERARAMYRTLAEHYNDGTRYQVHLVTARQTYNLVRAAENGCAGDPAQFVDFELGPQVTSRYCADAAHELRACSDDRLELRFGEAGRAVAVQLRYPGVRSVAGRLAACRLDAAASVLELETWGDADEVELSLAPPARLRVVDGAEVLEVDAERARLRVRGRATLSHG